jgi:hypothetical protein
MERTLVFKLKLPDLVEHIIFEFLDYKLRCGKYIKQLTIDSSIQKLITRRPKVEEVYYTYYDWQDNKSLSLYTDDDDGIYIYDEYGYEKYFMVSIVTKYIKRKSFLENTLEISYNYNDRNFFRIETKLYDYDYDGSKHWVD